MRKEIMSVKMDGKSRLVWKVLDKPGKKISFHLDSKIRTFFFCICHAEIVLSSHWTVLTGHAGNICSNLLTF